MHNFCLQVERNTELKPTHYPTITSNQVTVTTLYSNVNQSTVAHTDLHTLHIHMCIELHNDPAIIHQHQPVSTGLLTVMERATQ